MNPSQRPCHRILILLASMLLGAGCRSIGPDTVSRDRHNYCDAISESTR